MTATRYKDKDCINQYHLCTKPIGLCYEEAQIRLIMAAIAKRFA